MEEVTLKETSLQKFYNHVKEHGVIGLHTENLGLIIAQRMSDKLIVGEDKSYYQLFYSFLKDNEITEIDTDEMDMGNVTHYEVLKDAQPAFETKEAYDEWVESFRKSMSEHYNSK